MKCGRHTIRIQPRDDFNVFVTGATSADTNHIKNKFQELKQGRRQRNQMEGFGSMFNQWLAHKRQCRFFVKAHTCKQALVFIKMQLKKLSDAVKEASLPDKDKATATAIMDKALSEHFNVLILDLQVNDQNVLIMC